VKRYVAKLLRSKAARRIYGASTQWQRAVFRKRVLGAHCPHGTALGFACIGCTRDHEALSR